MKVLIVGSWLYPMYEKAFSKALIKLGHSVDQFSWARYFQSLMGKAEEKFSFGGYWTNKLNKDLLVEVKKIKPDVVLTWRATSIYPSTIEKMKRLGVFHVASYNHDDFTGPYVGAPAPWHHYLHWRLFLGSARYYDSHFVKRESNIQHLQTLGSQYNQIMAMWFDPEIHCPVQLSENDQTRFGCDVVFVGHYESDGREAYLRALVDTGLKVKLYGGRYWTRHVLGSLYDYFAPIVPAEGDDYAKALCGAKVCLAFLSKLNRDTYTRRCFEIPACGRVMLAERTDDLLKMFKEDAEACFFSSQEELVKKAKWLVENPDIREKIAQAGLRRVWADGHDVKSRAAELLSILDRMKNGQ